MGFNISLTVTHITENILGMNLTSELELLSKPELSHLSNTDRNLMRGWIIEHGQKVRQNTTRNTSTKDKPGMLPLNMYINYKQSDPLSC